MFNETTMLPKIQPILYAVSAFIVFTILSVLLKFITNHRPTDDEYFGLFGKKDILLGALVALILTFSHERKKKLK